MGKRDCEKCTEPAMGKEINNIKKRMEDFMERREREERKNNIIIKGMKGNETGETLRKKVEGFIRERIRVEAEVKHARKLGNGKMILAKIGTFEEKIKIMGSKKILGAEEIYIENDKTKKEREVHRVVVDLAKKEKEEDGEAVIKIGHWKMTVNGKVYKWNETKGRMESQDFWEKNVTRNEMET